MLLLVKTVPRSETSIEGALIVTLPAVPAPRTVALATVLTKPVSGALPFTVTASFALMVTVPAFPAPNVLLLMAAPLVTPTMVPSIRMEPALPVLPVVDKMREDSVSVIVGAVSDTPPAFPAPNEELETLLVRVRAIDSVAVKVMAPAGASPRVSAEIDAVLRFIVWAVMSIAAGVVDELPPEMVVWRLLRSSLTLAAGLPEPLIP